MANERISDSFTTMTAQEEEPVLLEGETEEISGVSKAISRVYNEEFRCHFVATMPIKAGDVLLVEKPSYAMSLNKWFNRTSICSYCLKYCFVSIPCKRCLKEVFCSEECLEEATEKYHKLECKEFNYVEFDDNMTAVFRMLIIFAKEEAVRKDAIKFMNKLDKQEEQEDPRTSLVDQTRRWHFFFVAYTAAKLKQESDFLQNNSELLGVAKFLYRLSFIFKENVMEIKHKDIPVGFGLYPTISFVNHSCVPNTIITTCQDYKKVLRACKDIKPGEQIFLSYLQGSLIMDSTERKEFLQKSFKLSCSCEACKTNYTFKNEVKEKLLLPEDLRRRLRKLPIDIEAMWRLLKIMQRDIKQPCLEVEIMNEALSDTYSGRPNHDLGPLYARLGVL